MHAQDAVNFIVTQAFIASEPCTAVALTNVFSAFFPLFESSISFLWHKEVAIGESVDELANLEKIPCLEMHRQDSPLLAPFCNRP